MNNIVSFLSSFLLLLTTTFKPESKITQIITPTMKQNTFSITKTLKPTARPTVKKTELFTGVSNDEEGNFVITARPGDRVRVTTFVPMKGQVYTSVKFGQDYPNNVSWVSIAEGNNQAAYLYISNSAVSGDSKWRQSFQTFRGSETSDKGLSLGIRLKIVAQ